jgi:hypothetical protein
VVEIDLDEVREFAAVCDRAARAVAGVSSAVWWTAGRHGLPTAAARSSREIADELAALSRFLQATADRVESADVLTAGAPAGSATIAGSVRSTRHWRRTLESLLATLDDDIGARAIDVARFSLAGSLVVLPRHEWSTAVIPPSCRSFGPERFYSGGGAVRGPDGELYPIVVPHLGVGNEVFTIDGDLGAGTPTVATLGGVDPGWVMVGYRAGVEQFHADVGAGWQVATALAGLSGLRLPPVVDDAALSQVVFRPGSRPFLLGAVDVNGGVEVSGPSIMPSASPSALLLVDGRAQYVPVDEIDRRRVAVRDAAQQAGVDRAAAGRIALPNHLLTLAVSAAQGISAALALGNRNQRAYEVVFEQHVDGRRRARVQTFALEARADGPHLFATHLSIGDDGQLLEQNASYRSGPTINAPGAVVASNGGDPSVVRPVPNPAIVAGSDDAATGR